MVDMTTDEEGLLRVNANLLPLLRRLGIKGGGGGFGMPPLVMPVINVETLQEVLATSQLTATVSAVLTNVGDAIQITVPAGEQWNVDHVFASSSEAATARVDSVRALLGGSFIAGIWNNVMATNLNNSWDHHENFDRDFFLVAGDIIEVERVNIVTAATNRLAVLYRLV